MPDGAGDAGTVSAKWAKGSGGPSGDECYNLVAAELAPTLVSGGNVTGGNRFPGTNVDAAAAGGLVVSTLRAGANRKGVRPPGLAVDEDSMLIVAAPLTASFAKHSGMPAGKDCVPQNLIVTAFEPRERGDDGRGYDRSPNFSENVSSALGTVKTPVIAFDCKAGGDTSFSVGDQAGALRAAHGGGHAAVSYALGSHSGTAEGESTNRSHSAGGPVGSNISEEQAYALRGGRTQAVAQVFKPSHFTRGKDGAPDEVSPPLSADADKGDQDPVLMTGTAVRRLTPVECERLQAFPDQHTNVIYRGAPAADGPRYKALGNAMNVLEVGWVLRRIEMFEATVRPTLEESR